ncbi:MAG TPA: ABC transporter permease [Patescibacteria group bacterium]|nr:ABC transporter permease [Patescibacteria group bacterium]
MAVKKVIVGLIFIALMLASYLHLANKYNLQAVEYAFVGDLSYRQFEDIRKATESLVKKESTNKELICIVNYIGSYKGNRLIMTTGFDPFVKNIPLLKGSFISDSQVREATIGDKAADRLFRSIYVVGQTINIDKKVYKITGVIKNCEDIYITFDESSNISWSKRNIKFIIQNQKYLYLYTEMLEGKLRTLNFEILDRVIYKQQAYLYMNIILITLVLFLLRTMKKMSIKTMNISREIVADYIEQSRRIEMIKYFRKNIRHVLQIIKELFLVAIYFIATIKCINYFQVPPNLVPNNLFALSSYIEVIKQNTDVFLGRLNYGLSDMTLDTHIMNALICIVLIGALLYLNESRQNIKKI